MGDARFEARLTELETRVAFQELALSELSDALAAARMEAARHADQLRRALEQLKQQGGRAVRRSRRRTSTTALLNAPYR